jgi:glycosyltransferase involved in cell wall biosynthesis
MSQTLHVCRTYYPDSFGGIQETIRQICLSTQNFAVQSQIFSLSPKPYPKELLRPEGRVWRERSWIAPASTDIGDFGAFKSFANLAKQSSVIHHHFPYPFADLLFLANAHHTPGILTYNSDIMRQRKFMTLYAPLMWQMLQKMKFIVATSPNYAQTSPVLMDERIRHKVRVIPFGIEENSYPKEEDPSILERLNLAHDQPFFLFVGVGRYYKGLHVLLEAAKQTRIPIVMAGSKLEYPKIQALAKEAKLEHVLFPGQVSNAEKMTLLRHCQALILPSHLRAESFGIVLLEAAMTGKAMISCEIGTGTSYVNLHQETGLVVPPSDANALASAMNTLIKDPRRTQEMGLAARERFENHFSGKRLGAAYAALYQEAELT